MCVIIGGICDNFEWKNTVFGQLQLFIVCNNLSKHSSFHAACASLCVPVQLYILVSLSIFLFQMMIEMVHSIALSISFLLVTSFAHPAFILMKIQFPISFPLNFKDFMFYVSILFTFTIHIDHFILSKLSITHLVCTLVFLIFSSLFSHCLSTEQIKSYWYKNTHICTHATVHRDHIDWVCLAKLEGG